jgi:hypothetical protein
MVSKILSYRLRDSLKHPDLGVEEKKEKKNPHLTESDIEIVAISSWYSLLSRRGRPYRFSLIRAGIMGEEPVFAGASVGV